MKLLITSANLGNIDESAQPHVRQELPAGLSVHFVRYDDATLLPRHNALHPRLQAKLPKMLGHELQPGYDWYMWIDASIYLAHPHAVIWMLSKLQDSQIAFFRHPWRSSIAAELAYCSQLMSQGNAYLDDRYGNEPMVAQVDNYLSDPSFVDDRLYCGGVFCYGSGFVASRPTFFSDWYYHCARHTVQDQLSLPYLLQKHAVRYCSIDDNLYDTPYFAMKQHLR
jgi:hypothetical protein